MKVRIGYGLGTRSLTNDASRFGAFVDALEGCGFDSLWLSERITGDCPDPLIGLAVAAGRTRKLKLGTSVQVLPGRNPVLLAKEWASLDRLSNGRTLPAFGLGVADPREQQAFGVARGDRAKWFDEALPLIRRLWTEDAVDHDGARFHFEAVSVRPKPVQQPPDVWLGGLAPSELRRIGRLGDGWLPSFCTPADVERARPAILEAAAAAGRTFDDEHWGALVAYTAGAIPDAVATALSARRPDLDDPSEVIASGLDGLHARIEEFVAAGASKFVVVPLAEPADWDAELVVVADALLPLQRAA
ncbi:MAG TPA: LLM class flavin-dependent oxidoreductase [Acidimicrobiales bacterium]|jgi:probable F420-dependent oxidoreductase|nr:LLM class flavin-dependent oxidoreductase [Acidimicrobiales bacterium]